MKIRGWPSHFRGSSAELWALRTVARPGCQGGASPEWKMVTAALNLDERRGLSGTLGRLAENVAAASSA